jgi:hypothetical protein
LLFKQIRRVAQETARRPTLKIYVEYPLTHHRDGLFRANLSFVASRRFVVMKVVKNMSAQRKVNKIGDDAGHNSYAYFNIHHRVGHDIEIFPSSQPGGQTVRRAGVNPDVRKDYAGLVQNPSRSAPLRRREIRARR